MSDKEDSAISYEAGATGRLVIGGLTLLLLPVYIDRYHFGGDGYIGGFLIGQVLFWPLALLAWSDYAYPVSQLYDREPIPFANGVKQEIAPTFWLLLALSPPAIVAALGHSDLVCVSFLLIGPMLALTRKGTGIHSASDQDLAFIGFLLSLKALAIITVLYFAIFDDIEQWWLGCSSCLAYWAVFGFLAHEPGHEMVAGLIAGRKVPAEIVPSKVDIQTDKPPLTTDVLDYRSALIEYFTYYKSHFVTESEIGFQAEIERGSADDIAVIIFNEMGVNDWYKKRSNNPQEFDERNQRLGAIEDLLPEDSDDTLDYEPKGRKKKSGVVDYADALTRVRCSQCDHPTEGGPRRGTYLCTNCGFMFDSHGNAI